MTSRAACLIPALLAASFILPLHLEAQELKPGKIKLVGRYTSRKLKEGKGPQVYFRMPAGKPLSLRLGGPVALTLLARGDRKAEVSFAFERGDGQTGVVAMTVVRPVSRGMYFKVPAGTHEVKVTPSAPVWIRPLRARRPPRPDQPVVAWRAPRAPAPVASAQPSPDEPKPAPLPPPDEPAPPAIAEAKPKEPPLRERPEAADLAGLCRGLGEDITARAAGQRVMIMPLDERSVAAKDQELGAKVADFLATCLRRDHGLELVEAQRRVEVLREGERALVGLTADDAKAAQVGKLAGAQVLVVGSVASLGQTFIFNLRAVSAEQGTVLAARTAKVAAADLDRFIKPSPPAAVAEALAADRAAPEPKLDLQGRPVEVRLRVLADRLAAGFAKLPGKGRYERVAVADLQESGEAVRDLELGVLVAAQLSTNLVRDHGFMLVERSRMEDVLKEIQLGMTGLLDEHKAAEAGKMAGAQAIVVGSVAEAGADFTVNVRLIATESSQVLVAESINVPRAGMVALSDEAVVLRSKSGALFRSMVVPGWGQFYNREPIKGGVLIGLELALAGTAVAMHFLGASDEDKYSASGFALKYPDLTTAQLQQKAQDLRDSAETYYQARNILIYTAVGVYLYNVLDAYLFGMDGREQLDLEVHAGPVLDLEGGTGATVSLGFSY